MKILNLFSRNQSGAASKKSFLRAFTLAEVLIALAVIGVVAAIIIASSVPKIQARVREHQISVAKIKFNRALEMMVLNGKVGPYYTDTYDFVSEFQKYLKINRVCRVGNSPSELSPVTDCFGENYTNVNLDDGETFPLANIATGQEFRLSNDASNDWTSPNIAFMTIDGTRMIVSYNKKCEDIAYDEEMFNGKDAAVATTCISGLYDINGEQKPNRVGKDVILFGSAKTIGNACFSGSSVNMCLSSPVTLPRNFLSQSDCLSVPGMPSRACNDVSDQSKDKNWFAAAAQVCGGYNNMLTTAELVKIFDYIHGSDGKITTSAIQNYQWSGMYFEEDPFNTTNLDDAAFERAAEFGINISSSSGSNTLITKDIIDGFNGKASILTYKIYYDYIYKVDTSPANSSYSYWTTQVICKL